MLDKCTNTRELQATTLLPNRIVVHDQEFIRSERHENIH